MRRESERHRHDRQRQSDGLPPALWRRLQGNCVIFERRGRRIPSAAQRRAADSHRQRLRGCRSSFRPAGAPPWRHLPRPIMSKPRNRRGKEKWPLRKSKPGNIWLSLEIKASSLIFLNWPGPARTRASAPGNAAPIDRSNSRRSRKTRVSVSAEFSRPGRRLLRRLHLSSGRGCPRAVHPAALRRPDNSCANSVACSAQTRPESWPRTWRRCLRGTQNQAIVQSRGGLKTKMVALVRRARPDVVLGFSPRLPPQDIDRRACASSTLRGRSRSCCEPKWIVVYNNEASLLGFLSTRLRSPGFFSAN